MSEPRQYSLFKAWSVVLVTSLFFFYEFGLNNLFNSLEVPVSQAYHLSSVEMGWIGSAYFYANIAFLIPAGLLLDRFSPRRLIALALLVCSSGVLVIALTHSVLWVVIARLLMGFGGGFCFIGCIRIAVNWFDSVHMARASGVIVSMGMLGAFLVQAPLTILMNHVGWRMATVWVAVAGYAVMLLIYWLVRDVPPQYKSYNTARHEALAELGIWQSIKLVFAKPQNWLCAIFGSMINLPIFLIGALWGVPYLMTIHQFSNTDAALVASMVFVGTIVGSPWVGWISDKLGRRKLPMLIGVLLSLILVYTALNIHSNNVWVMLVLFFLLGLTTSVQVLSYPVVAETNSRMVSSVATSIISMWMMLGGAIGQPLFGLLLALHWKGAYHNGTPVYSAANYHFAMNILPIAFVVSLIAALLIRETYCKRLVE